MTRHARRQDQHGGTRRAKDAATKGMSPATDAPTMSDASSATSGTPGGNAATTRIPRATTSRAAVTLGETIARTTALPGRQPDTQDAARSERTPAVIDAPTARPLALAETPAAGVLIRGAAKPPRPTLHIVPRRYGPRSVLAQFFGAMMVAIAILGTVTFATPLGQTTGLASAFQAYASGLPFIPTPTPTPKPAPGYAGPPHVADPGKQAVINEIVAVFGPYAQGALAVARCESGYDPNARNPYAIGNSHASGVFQILYPSTWDGTSYARYSPYDANANIHAAYELFSRDGYTWREWQCQP